MARLVALLLSGHLLVACGGDGGTVDASVPDGGDDLATSDDLGDPVTDLAVPADMAQPQLRYAYGITIGNRVFVARVDPASGALRVLGEEPAGTSTLNEKPKLSPDASLLVVTTAQGNGLASFVVDAQTGLLTAAPGSPYALGYQASNVAFAPSGKFVYALDVAHDKVQTFSVAGNGSLSQVGTGVAVGGAQTGLAVTPSGKHLYVGTSNQSVAGFSLQPDGTPAMLAGFPHSVGAAYSVNAVAVSPGGKFLAVSTYVTDSIGVYGIDDTSGALTAATGSPFALPATPQLPAFTADEKYLYLPFEATMRAYSVGADGALTLLATQPSGTAESITVDERTGRFAYVQRNYYEMEAMSIGADGSLGAGPRWSSYAYGISLSPAGAPVRPAPKYAYVADSEASPTGAIRAYSLDAAGAMTAIGTPVLVPLALDSVADPRGRWLYAVSQTDGVHAYAIASSGAAQEIVGSPYALSGASHLAIDPSARTLYVTRSSNNSVDTYAIDQVSGALTYGTSYTTGGTGPSGVAVSPMGSYLMVANQTSNDVAVLYAPTSGFLGPPANLPTGASTSPRGITYSPDGEHVFVTLSGSGELLSYSGIDLTGKPSVSSKYPVGSNPNAAVVDPSGRYVYATDSGASGTHLYQFSIDPTSAVLTALSPATVTSLAAPYALAIDPSGSVLLAACKGSPAGGLSRYTLGAGGVLTALSASPDVGPVPTTITIIGSR